jgi:hypothetical protein
MPGISSAPDFNTHRTGVNGVDGAAPTTKANGVNAKGFRWAVVDVVLESGVLTNLDFQVYLWSEATGSFVPVVNTDFQVTGIGEATQLVIPVYGGVFWVGVDALTGTAPVIGFNVAGYGEPSAF